MIPTLDHLRRAYQTSARATDVTPMLEARMLPALTGAAKVFVKPESLQRAGSFKIRGAYWRLTCLTSEEAARGVVSYSSGNFAQGLAAAGQALGIPVTIVMPIDAPKAKSDAARGYGATVILTEHGARAREEVALEKAREIAAEQGLVQLHPFDDPEVIAGQAGVGLEAMDQLAGKGPIDLVLCPCGGGGLIAGVALAFHYLSPNTKVIAVEPERFNGMGTSLAKGSVETMPLASPSICDGLMARRPGAAPWEAIGKTGLTGVTVSDASVRQAMRLAFDWLKLVLEPSGAAALAALLDKRVEVEGKSVLVITSGGNVSHEDFSRHISDA